jgi:hypothetical protein
MLLILAFLALFGQENFPDSAEVQIHSCQACAGKRIAHTPIGTLLFCVPRSMKVHRDSGFEGDVQDVITFSRRGVTSKLTVRSRTNPSGYRKSIPDWFPAEAAGHTSVRAWRCSEGTGRDLRLDRDGRYWRFMTFPLGWAEYGDVPADIAAQFDRVFDSLCCRPPTPSRR